MTQGKVRLFYFAAIASLSAACAKVEPVRLGRIVIDAPREFDRIVDTDVRMRDKLRETVTQRLDGDKSVTYEEGLRDTTHILRIRLGPIGENFDDNSTNQRGSVEVSLRPSGRHAPFSAGVPLGIDDDEEAT